MDTDKLVGIGLIFMTVSFGVLVLVASYNMIVCPC